MIVRRLVVSGLLAGLALGVAAPAASAAPAPAQSAECTHIKQRFDHNYERMRKHQSVAWQLLGESHRASGAERRTLEHRGRTHGRLSKMYFGWMRARADQLNERCGHSLRFVAVPRSVEPSAPVRAR